MSVEQASMQDRVERPGGERILVVDDDGPLRRAYRRVLEAAGFSAVLAATGQEAVEAVREDAIDVVVSDINMPGMDGMELLRAVRGRDLDLPVVLVTGDPSVETAARAVEYGALRYLVKPVERQVLVEAVARAAKLHRIAHLKREAAAYMGRIGDGAGDRAGLEASLERGIATLWMAYQPIVAPTDRTTVAYEALVRTREPSLPHPGALFSAAERLGWTARVGRVIRNHVAGTLSEGGTACDIFMNLHPEDLFDEDLYDADAPLSRHANRVVLEVTERAALDGGTDIPGRIDRLRALGYRVAIDDLGAGYAGLSYFTLLTPDVVKLDITLVRDLHKEAIKRKLVGSLTTLCRELGMRVVAEGIETPEERDTALALGCDYLQGYLFARPSLPFVEVDW